MAQIEQKYIETENKGTTQISLVSVGPLFIVKVGERMEGTRDTFFDDLEEAIKAYTSEVKEAHDFELRMKHMSESTSEGLEELIDRLSN